ncbi:MHD domain-containing protein [Entamoeba marina]
MISFRGLWIIHKKAIRHITHSESDTSQTLFFDYKVLFSRQFPSVNTRLKSIQKNRYSPLPNDNDMASYFKSAVEFSFVGSSNNDDDVVTISSDSPLHYRLSFLGKESLQCVYLEKTENVYFVTIPALVETHLHDQNFARILSNSTSFLLNVAGLCGKFFDIKKKRTRDEYARAFLELSKKLHMVVPYGTPLVNMDNEYVKALTKVDEKVKNNKTPSRKFDIVEHLLFTNEDNTQDSSLVILGFKGVVVGDVDLQGSPEMSLGFSLGKSGSNALSTVVQNISLYYSAVSTTSNDTFATDIKLTPPNYPFNLAYYTVTHDLAISQTKTIQQLLGASYIIDYDRNVFKVQVIVELDPIFVRLKYDALIVEIPLVGVKLDTLTNFTPLNANFTQMERTTDTLIFKIIKFDEGNKAIIAFQFMADLEDTASEYTRIRKPSFVSDLQNSFKPHVIIKTKLSSTLSGFNIDPRKIAIPQSKGSQNFTISQQTHIQAIVFARNLFTEVNQ